MLDYDDKDLIVLTALADDPGLLALATSSASLDESPKKNWVERNGSLPPYVRRLARAIMKTGKSKSQAISIAIGRIKKWAAGGDGVDADTQAKSAKALAAWEALKAKNKAGKVKLTSYPDGEGKYLMLSETSSYNTDQVRRAWDDLNASARSNNVTSDYSWVREVWNDHIIVENEGKGGLTYQKVPYEVQDGRFVFGNAIAVEQAWREVEDTAVRLTDDMTETELLLLSDVISEE